MDSTETPHETVTVETSTQTPMRESTRKVRAAVAEADRTFDFGGVITREWIERAFDIIIPDQMTRDEYVKFSLAFVSGWETLASGLLTDHKKALRSLGEGRWEIVMPEDQASFALNEASKKIKKAIRTASAVQRNTRVDLLNATQRASHNDAVGRLATLEVLNTRTLPK